MKFFGATAVILAFGVLNAYADIDPEKCQSGNIIENTLYGFLGTITQSTTTINTSKNQLAVITQNVTDQGNQIVTKTFNTFMGSILTTVSDLYNIPVDTLKNNCSAALAGSQALMEEALTLNANCSEKATVTAQQELDDVASDADTLQNAINAAIESAKNNCSDNSNVANCVVTVIADIPNQTTAVSKKVISASLDVASIDASAIVSSCSSDAVGNVLGNACTSLTDLQTCAKQMTEDKTDSQ